MPEAEEKRLLNGEGVSMWDKEVLELKVVTVNILNTNELYISNNKFFKKEGKIKRGTLSHLAPRTNNRTVYPGGRGAPRHGGARAPSSGKPLSPRPLTFRHVRREPA